MSDYNVGVANNRTSVYCTVCDLVQFGVLRESFTRDDESTHHAGRNGTSSGARARGSASVVTADWCGVCAKSRARVT